MSIATEPANGVASVTPSDTATILSTGKLVRALYIGTTGDVAVLMVDGTTAIFAAVPAGSILPVKAVKVLDTGTDAEDIVAMY